MNPLHLGHVDLIQTAMDDCDFVFIVVGSADKFFSEKNPFDGKTRLSALKELFGKTSRKLEIFAVSDQPTDEAWKGIVLSHISKVLSEFGCDDSRVTLYTPDSSRGDDAQLREQWFKNTIFDVKTIPVKYQISSTAVRQAWKKGDLSSIKSFLPDVTHNLLSINSFDKIVRSSTVGADDKFKDQCVQFVIDFAKNGFRIDLYPTRQFAASEIAREAQHIEYQWWVTYISEAQKRLVEKANRILNEKS